ncbi:MAG: site-specific integrase [Cyanobacteria bacterium REEB67]|nr:site-specific integrase [Cyanobacteria bacterium REEB67]
MDKKPPQKKIVCKDGLYKQGKIWYIRIIINGRQIRKAVGPDKAGAQLVLLELQRERSAYRVTGELGDIQSLKKKTRRTFAEMAESYLAERPHLKASTRRGYGEILKNYLLPEFGELNVDQITEERIARFQADVSKRVSAARTNNIMGPLRYILKVCVRRKLISDNPTMCVDPLREEGPTIDPLTSEELDRVLDVLKPYQKPLFICLAWTGARPDELFALRWADVDFERSEITISKGRVRGKEGTPKTKSSNRVIHMLSIVKQTLLDLKHSPTQHLDGYVFLSKKGQPYDKHVDREWRVALAKAGVRHRPSYQLRHTFASMCLQNGLQPGWVAKMLGHSTAQITFKHYARFIDDASNFNQTRLEAYLQSKKQKKNVNQKTLGAG